jgi:hypothetical protein
MFALKTNFNSLFKVEKPAEKKSKKGNVYKEAEAVKDPLF